MQKCLFFLLTLFSLTIQAKAEWNPYIMDHERFVHLSDQEKETVIIRTMEMMVELEAKYERQVKVSGYSHKRFKKYVQLLNKFQNFILSEAVAADFVGMQTKFSSLMKSKNACIYGGWPSQTIVSEGKTYCVHPSKAPDKKFRDAYQSGKCPGTDQITCNPMVFGFQKRASEKLFCVPTGLSDQKKNKAHNVSYECMRASLQVAKTDAQDSKAERLLSMQKDMETGANKEAFNSVHSYIFQSCACGQSKMDSKMDAEYLKYMRPHRTCFGMMNSLRAFNSQQCEPLTTSFPQEDKEFVDKWNNFFNDQNIKRLGIPSSKEPEKFDKEYGALINHGNVAKYCEPETPVTPVVPVVPIEDAKPEWICKTKCAPQESKKEGEIPKVVCTITEAGWNITKAGKTEFKSVAEELVSKEIIVDDPKAVTAEIGMKDEKQPKQLCPVEVKPVAVAKTCTIAVADAEDPNKVTATVTFQGLDDKVVPEYTWTGGTASKDKPEEVIVAKTDKDEKVSVTFTIPGSTETLLPCEGDIPKLGEEAKGDYGIDTKADAPQPLTVKVHATLSLKGVEIKEAPAGHYISWVFTGPSAPKTKKVEKVKEKESTRTKDTPVETKDDKAPATKDGDAKEKEPKGIEGEVEIGKTVDATRTTAVYQACASLINKGTGKSVTGGPSCKPIPPVAQPNYTPPNNNQNAPTPQFMVPVRNAPAGGIL